MRFKSCLFEVHSWKPRHLGSLFAAAAAEAHAGAAAGPDLGRVRFPLHLGQVGEQAQPRAAVDRRRWRADVVRARACFIREAQGMVAGHVHGAHAGGPGGPGAPPGGSLKGRSVAVASVMAAGASVLLRVEERPVRADEGPRAPEAAGEQALVKVHAVVPDIRPVLERLHVLEAEHEKPHQHDGEEVNDEEQEGHEAQLQEVVGLAVGLGRIVDAQREADAGVDDGREQRRADGDADEGVDAAAGDGQTHPDAARHGDGEARHEDPPLAARLHLARAQLFHDEGGRAGLS
mmetsp:Transcript_20856/g.63558  ORF Transcript_20856/g.63558 Transcript_20856/m.63558 type:complete len:290 (+) Transcript_20856:83-952(+)